MNKRQRIVFRVPGKPQTNQRHRTTKSGHTYTPDETTSYRNWVKQCFVTENKDKEWFYEEGPLEVKINIFFEIPKSYPKWKVDAIHDYKYFPKKKPDCDNIAKGILDALNKIAFKDDSQVIDLTVHKQFVRDGSEPCVVVTMENIPQPESKKEYDDEV